MARYVDDSLIGFEYQEDADRVMNVLGKRFARFGLELHPERPGWYRLGVRRSSGGVKVKTPLTFSVSPIFGNGVGTVIGSR